MFDLKVYLDAGYNLIARAVDLYERHVVVEEKQLALDIENTKFMRERNLLEAEESKEAAEASQRTAANAMAAMTEMIAAATRGDGMNLPWVKTPKPE
jgi:hypothetical protein